MGVGERVDVLVAEGTAVVETGIEVTVACDSGTKAWQAATKTNKNPAVSQRYPRIFNSSL